MRQSQLFSKTRREAPKDEVAKNAQLLIRAGFVHKELAGVYSYLPLGWRVMEKIAGIIRREMDALGATELQLAALQNPETWQATGRWSDEVIDVWFKTKLQNDSALGLGLTHEEPLVKIMREHLRSYRDLPAAAYQIQTKFRNEPRAKSGLLRGREFLMKDLYSFHADEADLEQFYARVAQAYKNIFATVGLGDRTYMTFASGGAFSRFSDEFQTLCEAGEDTIYLALEKGVAINMEVATEENLAQLGVTKEELVPHQSIEVGNIFHLGTRFAEALGLTYRDETGAEKPVVMASYGIGIGRLLGTIVEALADERGLVWPASVAPFAVHLVELTSDHPTVHARAEALYHDLLKRGKEVLWDDRDLPPGEKFADSDLIGIPERIVVSEKTLAADQFEVKNRATGQTEFVHHV